jgi:hypothetical protein
LISAAFRERKSVTVRTPLERSAIASIAQAEAIDCFALNHFTMAFAVSRFASTQKDTSGAAARAGGDFYVRF